MGRVLGQVDRLEVIYAVEAAQSGGREFVDRLSAADGSHGRSLRRIPPNAMSRVVLEFVDQLLDADSTRISRVQKAILSMPCSSVRTPAGESRATCRGRRATAEPLCAAEPASEAECHPSMPAAW